MSHTGNLTVRAAALTGFAALCRHYGIDSAHFLREAGLPAAIESDPDSRVSIARVNLAFDNAARACGQDDFGLQMAQLRGLSNLGQIGLLARDAPTVGAACALIEAHLPAHNDALVLQSEAFDDCIVLRATVLGTGPKMHANDVAIAMYIRILRQLAGSDWAAEEVCLSRPPPRDASRFHLLFGRHVRFGAAFDGIVVRAELLERPNQFADPVFRRLAAQAVQIGAPGRSESMTARVQRSLPLLIAGKRCTAGHVAERLGISRRTLVRQLAAEGTGFLSLLDDARGEIARHHLEGRGQKLSDVGDMLGFSSPAAFSTWFRRRYSVTPRDWQKANARVAISD